MQGFPKVGSSLETRFLVEAKHAIALAEGNLPPILATPWLIWFLEHAALELLKPFLDPGEISVGSHVDIEHLAAALVGEEIVCSARIIHHEGPAFTFQVEAHDQKDCLAKGLHKRRVVETSRLARRLQKKRGQ
jgi:predicted thioesterase